MAIAFATPLATTHSSSSRPSTSSSTSSSSSLLTSSSTTTTAAASAPTRSSSSSKPTYIRSGIGGAGNWHKKASTLPPPRSPATPLPSHGHTFHAANMDTSPIPLLPSHNHHHHHHQTTTTHIKSGIGGFGNIHAVASPAALQRLEEERAARTRRAMAEVQQKRQHEGFRVGIGGAGNFRVRGRRLMGHLVSGGSGGMKRREGDGVVEAGVGVVPRGTGWEAVEDEDEDEGEEEVWEKGDEGAVYYSDEPLPYGALDVLRRRVERAFVRGGREVLATLGEKGRAVQVGGGVGEQGHERRFLRSHRSMWRF